MSRKVKPVTLAPSEKPIPYPHWGVYCFDSWFQVASLPHSLWGPGNIIRCWFADYFAWLPSGACLIRFFITPRCSVTGGTVHCDVQHDSRWALSHQLQALSAVESV